MNAKEKLLAEIQRRQIMKTSDVIRYGMENFSNRAERNMRQLHVDGKVIRMPEEEKLIKYGNLKEEIWKVLKN